MEKEWILNHLSPKEYKHNLFVLDEEFQWNLEHIQYAIDTCVGVDSNIPIIFCDPCQANDMVSLYGEEENIIPFYVSGLYWREVGAIFIFHYEDYTTTIRTIFHELRHMQQDQDDNFRLHFHTDKALPYEKRITEIDAYKWEKIYLEKAYELQLL